MRVSKRIVVGCIGLLSIIPASASVEEQKKVCSAAQTASLDAATAAARAGLAKVIRALKSGTIEDQDRFLEWFGAGGDSHIRMVTQVYETSLGLSNFSTYWCPNNSIPELTWDVGDLAAVHPAAPGSMFFTPEFFDLPLTGVDSQQGTIVHELSHRSGATLKPEVYQPGPAKNLAVSHPANAARNGDNFQYYYEDLLFGAP